jgi:hypothetical protein
MCAPKAAKYLRRNWRSSYPETEFGALASQTGYGQSLRVSLGLGFAHPLSRDFGQEADGALAAWLGHLHAPQPDLFAILLMPCRQDCLFGLGRNRRSLLASASSLPVPD